MVSPGSPQDVRENCLSFILYGDLCAISIEGAGGGAAGGGEKAREHGREGGESGDGSGSNDGGNGGAESGNLSV